jgi:hypothetical protein
MTTIAFISLMLSITGSCIIVSYESYAITVGWRIGSWFRGTTILTGYAALNAIGTVGIAWLYYSFWWALGIFVAGWILSLLVTVTLKQRAQPASIALLLISYILQFFQ